MNDDENTIPSFTTIADHLKLPVAKSDKRPPNSELSATVDEVVKVIPLTKRYGYGFWLKLIKRSGVSYSEIFGMMKEINAMGNDKAGKPYNKAGTLVNKLKKLCIINKQSTASSMQSSMPMEVAQNGKRKQSKVSKSKKDELPKSSLLQMNLF